MDISGYLANWRWEGNMVNWASREVADTQMDIEQWDLGQRKSGWPGVSPGGVLHSI